MSTDNEFTNPDDTLTVALVSLGCPKNLVESEVMLAELGMAGFAITGDYADADVIVVNTCGFLQSAQAEAADTIDYLVQLKAPNGRCTCLIVAGCWSQIAAGEIAERWSEVDVILGVNDRHTLLAAIQKTLHNQKRTIKASQTIHPMTTELDRFLLTPEHWAYLRISEGCSQRCAFCTIPTIRGDYRSKPLDDIVNEARQLVDHGLKELILIGQETTNYGSDFNDDTDLATLLEQLDAIDGIDWIRIMYTYPANFNDRTIAAIADLPHVVKYIDIPLQHISSRVLKHMRRRIDREGTETLLKKLRSQIPDIVIRTTMVVGFPSETDAEFQELLQFVKDFKFDALGAFAYSPEPGSPAATMDEQIDEQVKLQRLNALMEAQQKIAYRKAKQWIEREFDVYIESVDESGKWLECRHSQQAPEVDPVTLVRAGSVKSLSTGPGDKLTVKCTGTRKYDLVAMPAHASQPTGRNRDRKKR